MIMVQKAPRCSKCKKRMGIMTMDTMCYRCRNKPSGKWEITGLI